mgnify:CR=1 FL=1
MRTTLHRPGRSRTTALAASLATAGLVLAACGDGGGDGGLALLVCVSPARSLPFAFYLPAYSTQTLNNLHFPNFSFSLFANDDR